MLHQTHQTRYTKAGPTGHKVANPVIADVEPFEEAPYAEYGARNLDAAIHRQNHIAYPIGETDQGRPILRRARSLARKDLSQPQQAGNRKCAHGSGDIGLDVVTARIFEDAKRKDEH